MAARSWMLQSGGGLKRTLQMCRCHNMDCIKFYTFSILNFSVLPSAGCFHQV